jgi:hypothetical protein
MNTPMSTGFRSSSLNRKFHVTDIGFNPHDGNNQISPIISYLNVSQTDHVIPTVCTTSLFIPIFRYIISVRTEYSLCWPITVKNKRICIVLRVGDGCNSFDKLPEIFKQKA